MCVIARLEDGFAGMTRRTESREGRMVRQSVLWLRQMVPPPRYGRVTLLLTIPLHATKAASRMRAAVVVLDRKGPLRNSGKPTIRRADHTPRKLALDLPTVVLYLSTRRCWLLARSKLRLRGAFGLIAYGRLLALLKHPFTVCCPA